MTPECLSREVSPGPESYPDSTVSSPAGQLTSQSAPGSPGHPYASSSQSSHKGRLMQQITVVTNGVSGDTTREGNSVFIMAFFMFLILEKKLFSDTTSCIRSLTGSFLGRGHTESGKISDGIGNINTPNVEVAAYRFPLSVCPRLYVYILPSSSIIKVSIILDILRYFFR